MITQSAFAASAPRVAGWLARTMRALDTLAIDIGVNRVSLLNVIVFVIVSVVIFAAARIAFRIVKRLIRTNGRMDASQKVLAQKVLGLAIISLAILIGVDLLAIDLTAFTVFSGAFGLAVGFGMQKTLGNLIAGLILLMDRSVKPGDVIVVGDTFGAISKIGIRAVSVVTRDGKEHLIPNEKLMTDSVENWSYSSRNVRLRIPVGVAYSSDLALAQRLMLEAASSATRVIADPKPTVWLKGFGDSSVDHDILVWITDPEMGVGNVQSEILNKLWVLFKQHSIEIPYPQRDVHIRSPRHVELDASAASPEPVTKPSDG